MVSNQGIPYTRYKYHSNKIHSEALFQNTLKLNFLEKFVSQMVLLGNEPGTFSISAQRESKPWDHRGCYLRLIWKR